jgi:hypothetical protein
MFFIGLTNANLVERMALETDEKRDDQPVSSAISYFHFKINLAFPLNKMHINMNIFLIFNTPLFSLPVFH